MRALFLALLLLCLPGVQLLAGDGDTPPLPAPAQKILDKLNDDIAKLKAKAAEDLHKVQVQETKAGDLDGALAVKKAAEELMPRFNPGEVGKDDEVYIGTWIIANVTTLKVLKDGTAFWGSTPGTWTKGEKTLKFSWGNEIDIPASNNCKVIDHGRDGIVYDVSITNPKE